MLVDLLELYRHGESNINSVILRSPTLNEICDYGEVNFFSMAAFICAIPTDYMVELTDRGIRYEDVSEYDFFIEDILPKLSYDLCHIILPNIHPEQMKYAPIGDGSGRIVVDFEEKVILDQDTYIQVTRAIRKMFGFKYRPKFAQNELTRQKLIEVARRKRDKQQNQPNESVLLPLISAMVNCSDFKYNHEQVWNMSFYAFMDSVKRVNAVRSANQMSTGGFFGIKLADVQEHLDWMRPL